MRDDYEHLQFRRDGRVLTIVMNRPEVKNASNIRMHRELSRVFADAQQDAGCDIVVLTGAGDAFSSGGDIRAMVDKIADRTLWNDTVDEARALFYSILDLEKPLIARVNGAATGLGATLAVYADISIAADTAVIGEPHVKVGLVAGDGGALLWPQLMGYVKAKKYLLTGDLMTAAEAERAGLISDVVPADQLDAATYGLAERLEHGAIKAIQWTKITANLPLKAIVHSHFDAGIAYESLSNRTADHAEAVAAFRERRAPIFTGK